MAPVSKGSDLHLPFSNHPQINCSSDVWYPNDYFWRIPDTSREIYSGSSKVVESRKFSLFPKESLPSPFQKESFSLPIMRVLHVPIDGVMALRCATMNEIGIAWISAILIYRIDFAHVFWINHPRCCVTPECPEIFSSCLYNRNSFISADVRN